ncbi:hypothetical protein [Sphingomonas sp. 1P08PE]|uniref:hypothetical protein n=1 Tax=Sphingomonas sp. 1P08PE TaxID=554122 RepID=UPI0039A0D80D
MTLAEQAVRRIALALAIGARPQRWIVTREAEDALLADALPDAWSADHALLHGLPVERGRPRSEWGLDLVLAPSAA